MENIPMADILKIFHPLVGQWFVERFGKPSRIQEMTWREIASGSHILATAPTGSGKTLAAFLWAIDQLITGKWPLHATRILYISPLKALNNDIRRNLLSPLQELAARFEAAAQPFPNIRVMTRSGDTPADERRTLLRHPPEILITTPESLNIMLTGSGRTGFTGLRTVILDEIHGVAGGKRGTHLMTAVERLTLTSGEFQRIALSATVRPLELTADFVGGLERLSSGSYRKRAVKILRSDDPKRYSISVEFVIEKEDQVEEENIWRNLAGELKAIARRNSSTLIFTKSRRAAEKIARHMNEGEEEIIAYSHHGSISREIRLEVEERMKKGELKAIVATSSLELGIDIGELDEVILVQTPSSVSSALQRLGRAGHRVGQTSSGRLYPTHGIDLLTAAVMAGCMAEGDIEPLHPVECPLDILAQVIVSMTASEKWTIDSLYSFLRGCHPYRNLPFRQYELVLEMLAGRYAETRLKELAPRISLDRIDNTVQARQGSSYLVYTSGGTIPDRGYYELRVKNSRSRIGELDEEFVWERRVGDTFTLGTQTWRIERITHNEVEVSPQKVKAGMVPFWRAEEQDREFFYAERIMEFLREAEKDLPDPEAFRERLRIRNGMGEEAALALEEFLRRQKDACAGKLPHRSRVVIEEYHGGTDRGVGRQFILHTLWGGRLNRPFAMVLSAAWEKKYGAAPEVYADDANILVVPPDADSDPAEVIRMVTPENIGELLRRRLESSGFFGARFRESAARALLLPRPGFHKRYPLWMNRMRAGKLHELVMRYPDFPIVLETWRECLQDSFDLSNLKMMLEELHCGLIELTEVENEVPSPFCGGMIWRRTNKYMYADDTPEGVKAPGLSRKLLDEVLYSSQLRPRIPRSLTAELEARLQRLKPGYPPAGPEELLDWLKERLLIPGPEWERLLEACRMENADNPEFPNAITRKITSVILRGSITGHICAVENLPMLKRLFDFAITGENSAVNLRKGSVTEGEMDRADFLAQWISYYGPMPRSWVEEALGIGGHELDSLLEELVEQGRLVVDVITEGFDNLEICFTENLSRLLRMARLSRQPAFQPLPMEYLPLFIASWQGLTQPGDTMEDLQSALEKLFGYPALANLWEEEIIPARMKVYHPSWLDALLASTRLLWFGAGRQSVSFALEPELDIVAPLPSRESEKAGCLFPDPRGRYTLFDIAANGAIGTEEATRLLWELTWKSAVTNDSMESLRKGIMTGFTPGGVDGAAAHSHGSARRTTIHRWAAGRPVQGSWRLLETGDHDRGGIAAQESARERARILFDRYGILFRQLLEYESKVMGWKELFPALRLMELSGEILSGYFFEGIPGVQFISLDAFRLLRGGLDEESIFWMNAKDPASLCGIGIEEIRRKLPRRIPSNHLVFFGKNLALESMKNGRELKFHIPPDHPRLHQCLGVFKALLTRGFNPLKGVYVESINGVGAERSDYREVLRKYGFISVYRGMELRRGYQL